jgi:hypothetical protein
MQDSRDRMQGLCFEFPPAGQPATARLYIERPPAISAASAVRLQTAACLCNADLYQVTRVLTG